MDISVGKLNLIDPAQIAQDIFKKLDANGDGIIDKQEFKTALDKVGAGKGQDLDKFFSQIDANGDGKINSTESESWLKKMGQELELQHALLGMQGSQKGKGDGDGSSGGKDSSVITDPADTDCDGEVSYSEFLAYQLQHRESYQQTGSSQQVKSLMDLFS